MNKIDNILNKSFNIVKFETFDLDTEWEVSKSNNFLDTDRKEVQKDNIKILKIVSRIAAVFFIITMVLSHFKGEKTQYELLTTADESQKIELIDGSTIILDKQSKVSYYISLLNQNQRSVELVNGKAEFDITKSILPFKLFINELEVEVLGTKFDVSNLEGGIIQIHLAKGKLQAREKNNPDNFVLLHEGDTFTYQNGIFTNSNLKTEEELIIESKPELKVQKISQVEESPAIEESPVIEEPIEEVKLKRFKLDSVIKNHLLKHYKKQVKLGKKVKLDYDLIVEIDDINKSPELLLKDLKSKGIIDYTEGDCENCFVILEPIK